MSVRHSLMVKLYLKMAEKIWVSASKKKENISKLKTQLIK